MLEKMKNLVVEEEGQALTEYGLIIALVSVLLAGSLILFKDQLVKVFDNIKTALTKTS
ncbi:Flp family type IVb pilin [Neobacillus sp. WH10]|uniref:Flp family type IVb pilin n=1 Tax=Neobacillus sp. WH10 TaxID=3047873 RepID=UPI0024C170F6|nr:Flp family type IVb pilin [Neobacillus sp. WH10]WHY76786.1 Flp family type IVb pilin [Neobacillus sp. WH10]